MIYYPQWAFTAALQFDNCFKKGTARFPDVKNKALVTPFYVYVPAPHPALTGFGTGIFANLQIFFVNAKKKEGKNGAQV